MNSFRFKVSWLASFSHHFLLRMLLSFILTINLVIVILDRDPFRNSFLGHVYALIDMLTVIHCFFQLRTCLSLWLYSSQFPWLLHILFLFTYVATDGRKTLIQIVSILLYRLSFHNCLGFLFLIELLKDLAISSIPLTLFFVELVYKVFLILLSSLKLLVWLLLLPIGWFTINRRVANHTFLEDD
jgi:hypothetical protein